MRVPIVRCAAGFAALLALAAAAPRPAAAQALPVLTRLNSPSLTVDAGTSKLLRVQLTLNGQPLPGNVIDWQILSTTANATGPASSVTDAAGIASARFHFPLPGVTRIRALWAQVTGAGVSVDYTVTSVTPPPPPPPPPPTETHLVLQPAGATSLAVVLGERADLAVVLRSATGAPAPGVLVRFTVEPSPGSPGVFPLSDQFASTQGDGVAATSFYFSMVGRVVLRAASADPAFVFEPASLEFTVDVGSLSALVPGRRTWRSAAEALDAICLDVFVDEQGNPRPVPRLVPLCTYMTSALSTRGERTDAIVALTPTGLAAQTATALAGIEGVRGSVHSRLTALRGGGARAAVDHLALAVDGTEISNDALAAANRDGARFSVFSRRLDESFARLYAGLDAGDEPAAAPTVPQVAPRRERPWGFFATGRLTRGDRSRGVEVDAFDFDTAGVTAGLDRAVAANGFLGFALSGLRNRTDLAGGGGQLDADSWAATLYGIHEGEKGYLQATATYGRSRYDQRRRLALPVVGDLTARADFDGDQLAADLELGRSIDGRAGSLTAFVRGSWARATVDAFRERGAVAPLPVPGTHFGAVDFGVAVDRQELESLVGAGGLDWGKAFSIPGGLVIPQLTATWSHEFSGDAQQVRARFLGDTAAAASFFVFTDTPDRDWLTASAALRFQYLWGSFFVSYDHELMRDDLELRTANAGLRFEF